MRTKSYNKKKMLSLLLVPVFACTVGTMAYAAPCPGTISGVATSACTLTGTNTLTVTSTGALNVSGSTAVYVDASATGVTSDNSGKIVSSGTGDYGAIYVDRLDPGATITEAPGASGST